MSNILNFQRKKKPFKLYGWKLTKDYISIFKNEFFFFFAEFEFD